MRLRLQSLWTFCALMALVASSGRAQDGVFVELIRPNGAIFEDGRQLVIGVLRERGPDALDPFDFDQPTVVEVTIAGPGVGTEIVFRQEDQQALLESRVDVLSATRARVTVGSGSQFSARASIVDDTLAGPDREVTASLSIVSGADGFTDRFDGAQVYEVVDDDPPGPDLELGFVARPLEGGTFEMSFFVRNLSGEPGVVFEGVVLEIDSSLDERACTNADPNAPDVFDRREDFSFIGATYRVPVGSLTTGEVRAYRLCTRLFDRNSNVLDDFSSVRTLSAEVTASGGPIPDRDPTNESLIAVLRNRQNECSAATVESCCAAEWLDLSAGPDPQAQASDALSAAGGVEASVSWSSRWARQALEVGRSLQRFFGAAGDLALLYRVRDSVLSATPGGRRAIELYYEHSGALRDLMIADPEVRDATLDALDEFGPLLRALERGSGAEVVLDGQQVGRLEQLLDLLEERAPTELRTAVALQRQRTDPASLVGRTASEALERLDRLDCAGARLQLCLGEDQRFSVDVRWLDFEDRSDIGVAREITEDTGAFWFFDEQNLELLVKVLDARGVNGAFWVFFGALSNVEYEVTVTDTQTGAVRVYRNELGAFGSFGDTQAFPESGGSTPAPAVRQDGSDLLPLHRAPLPLGSSSMPMESPPEGVAAAMGTCVEGPTTLCLGSSRFALEVDWTDFEGVRGFGTSVPLSADTGAFWFFGRDNLELMVKVLDGRSINGRWWIFYGALSNVGYTLRVTDTVTGEVATYDNPRGRFGSVGDTEALGGE